MRPVWRVVTQAVVQMTQVVVAQWWTGQCEVVQILGKLPLHRPGFITQTAVVCFRCSDNMLNIRFRSTLENFSCVGAEDLAIQVFRDDPQLDALRIVVMAPVIGRATIFGPDFDLR